MRLSFPIKFWLGLIVVLFLVTRLYAINSVPVSMYWDEASISYNAYSILKTGHDEWGQFLPIHFKAFGEYKLPVFIYSVVPFTAVFGPTELAVRIPAVVYAFFSVILVYFLGFEITGKKVIGLISSFFLTISPWFFIFSRTGYEAMAGLAFYLLGTYLLFKISVFRWSILLSTFSFILSIYSYNSFRILVPLTMTTFIIFNSKYLKDKIKILYPIILISLLIFAASLIPLVSLLNSGGAERLNQVGIFNLGYGKKQLVVTFVSNYFSHFSPQFLLNGDINLRSQQKGQGQIYLLDVLLLLLGLMVTLKLKNKKYFWILTLLLMAPIPAALTKESPHALRSIAAVPFISIISATGFYFLITKVKFKFILVLFCLVYLILFGSYFKNFLEIYPSQSADSWQYGYKQIYTEYGSRFDQFDRIIISDMYSQPYIFALAYLKYDPDKFRSEVQYNTTIRKETSLVKNFGKFYFESIDINNIPKGKNLIFAHPKEQITKISPTGVINNPDGSVALYIYEYEK